MPGPINPDLGVNSWLEDELYQQYLHDRGTVDESWKRIFETNGRNGAAVTTAPAAPAANGVSRATNEPPAAAPGEEFVPLRGVAARIAENMADSLSIPTATSQRTLAVKVIDENRRVINQYRSIHGQSKISYTHLVGWAIVKALAKVPALNNAFFAENGSTFKRVRRQVNLGLAVDVAGKDGGRSLVVPNIKNANAMTFDQFAAAYDDIIARARAGKLTVSDFEGTTISLTNPGTVGTVGSIPRLMPGQGAIIATGAIDYPAEYQGVTEEMRALLGLSKVMTVTCTYDHRVIQGAESGAFLGQLQALLEGEDGFYEEIFRDLGIMQRPVRWEPDQAAAPLINADPVKQAAVARFIQAWRERGHLESDLDPLGSKRPPHPDLDPLAHGLTIWDLDRTFHAGSFGVMTLRALADRLRSIYAGKMGVQYMHIDSPEERRWLESRIENPWSPDAATRKRILKDIVEAEGFELFLDHRFKGHKRFSLEGGESMAAMVDELLERAAAGNVAECVIGMSHRGRLSTLVNIVGKSMLQLFSEFDGDVIDPASFEGQGDVKYHLGATGVRKTSSGREITVTVAFNPSHLEAVNPVTEGLARPKQDRLGDEKRERVIPLLIHGDAAMAGQGIVAETMNLSQVRGYTTGGTVHIVVNNQIGFTTNPEEARSDRKS